MKSDRYAQFPLCALSYGSTERERIDAIICYAAATAGRAALDKATGGGPDKLSAELPAALPIDYNPKKQDHTPMLAGSGIIGAAINSATASVSDYHKLRAFRLAFEAKHGTDAELRLPTKFLFEVRDRTGMSYRELSVFCAVVSCIGRKKYPVRITRLSIQQRSLGYKSTKAMTGEMPSRTDGARPLSLAQINRTLDKLHERQFFARRRKNERQTYYSIRLNQAELDEQLMNSAAYSAKFHASRKQSDASFIQKMKQAKSAIKVNAPIEVNGGAENQPKAVHSGVTSAFTQPFTQPFTLIETHLIETPLIKTQSIQTLGESQKPSAALPSFDMKGATRAALEAIDKGIEIPEATR